MKSAEINLLLSSDNDAGLPDLERFRVKYKKAKIHNLHGMSTVQKAFNILFLYKKIGKIIIHTQSDKWGLIAKILIPAYHIQVVHVQKDFVFAKKHKILHKILYFLNRTLSNKNMFLSNNVAKSFNYRGKLINFEKFITRGLVSNRKPTFCFFFGRDEKYKNLDFFLKIAAVTPEVNFKIYSNNYSKRDKIPDNIVLNKNRLTDSEVAKLYNENGILILPYSKVAQSGPFYLGLENGLNILVPNNEYFSTFEDVNGVFLLSSFDEFSWRDKILGLIT